MKTKMKKTILTLVTIIATATMSSAQKGAYAKGDKLLNIGIGVNSYYDNGIPLGGSFEKGITDKISVGADVNYLSSKYDYGFGASSRFTALYIGARGSYHLSDDLNIGIDELDLYGTGSVGFRSFTWSDSFGNNDSSFGNGIYVGVSAGARYYFSDKMAAFLELGATGSSNARLGIAFKF